MGDENVQVHTGCAWNGVIVWRLIQQRRTNQHAPRRLPEGRPRRKPSTPIPYCALVVSVLRRQLVRLDSLLSAVVNTYVERVATAADRLLVNFASARPPKTEAPFF